MGVILDEVAYAHDPMQGPGGLIAVAGTELSHTQRQVAIAFEALIKDLDVTRTVHGLDRVLVLF